MRTGLTKQLRELLRAHPDGLSTTALAGLIRRDNDTVRSALDRMPDVYKDRWDGPVRGQYVAVWCVVVPPPDCPHPTRRVK